MTEAPHSILFLCTGNSARSILAEAVVNRLGQGKFVAYSAGSHPKDEVHPQALKLLDKLGYDTAGFRSKPWDEFAVPGAPQLDFVITVCDNAVGEVCPIWPGQPISAHWGLPDPAAVTGSETTIALAFAETYRMLSNRIGLFASLPVASLNRQSLKTRMDDIAVEGRRTPLSADAQVQFIDPSDASGEALLNTFVDWLVAADLPIKDLADDLPRYFVLKDPQGAPLAFGGLAGMGSDLLLRSIVVDPSKRGSGAGARLVEALESVAKQEGVERLWALTTGAEEWLVSRGWRRVDRTAAPQSIQRKGQFKDVCPSTATLLVRDFT